MFSLQIATPTLPLSLFISLSPLYPLNSDMILPQFAYFHHKLTPPAPALVQAPHSKCILKLISLQSQILSEVMPPRVATVSRYMLYLGCCISISVSSWNTRPHSCRDKGSTRHAMQWVLMIFTSSLKMYFKNCYIYEAGGWQGMWHGKCDCYCAFALNY